MAKENVAINAMSRVLMKKIDASNGHEILIAKSYSADHLVSINR